MERIVDVVAGSPHVALRDHVERYVGYRLQGFPAGLHRGLPSRHLTFIVSLAAPIDVTVMPDPAQQPGAFSAVLGGLQCSPAVIAHAGDQVGIAIEVAPLAGRALFGMPAGAIASTVVELSDVLGRRAVGLAERLAAAPSWPERFAILDQVLAGALRDHAEPCGEVAWGWQRLIATEGTIPVGALAQEVGWSRRHFGERFRLEVGLPPKVAARVVRFDRARQLLERADRPGLATVAAVCGYADQAHLTREWGELAGCTPTVWIAEELPSVQDALGAAGAH